MIRHIKKDVIVPCVDCAPSSSFIETVPGLAYSIAQAADLMEKGIPISTATVSPVYLDGESNPKWTLSPEYRRGVDMADLWELKNEVKQNVKKAIDEDNRKFY